MWRHRWAILIVACVAAAGGYLYANARPSAYEAVSRVALANPYDRTLFRQERGVAFVDIERYLDTQADLVTSAQVLARASDLLEGRLRPAQIRQHLTAESSTRIFQITIRARVEDPALAAEVANAVTRAYQDAAAAQVQADVEASVAQLAKLEADLRRRLTRLRTADTDPRVQAERDALGDELVNLQTRAGQIRADAAVYGAGIERVERAFPSEQPVSNSPRRSAAIFGLLGFIAALVWAFWRSERVQVVDNSDDATGAADAPLLGALPSHPADTATAAAPVVTAPGSSAARDHQFIAASLALLGRESQPRVLLVTSPEATAGKSVTALNLALAAAQNQRAVILADVDAAGGLTSLLGADRKRGMSDLIARSTADRDVVLSDCRDRLLDGGFPAERVRVKPHFVEDPGPRSAPPSQSHTVLHVGRLSADKGSHALLDAWAALGDTELELICIGDGPLRDQLSRRQLPRVRFIGAVDAGEVRAWMLRARVLIAPSTGYETFGLAVAEAMAAGLPVIVPSGGALAEVAGDGAAVQPDSTDATDSPSGQFTRSLHRARDDAVIDLAGASGRARFSAHFTKTHSLTRLIDTYQSVLRPESASSAHS